MDKSAFDEFDVRAHLDAYWLRPESAFWDAIAARYIGKELAERKDILEIGIGNGFFSFLMLGGRFKPEFDWFYSVNTQGFWQNADIFDCDTGVSIANHIESAPTTRIKIGVDHKQSLLSQAGRLGFVDSLVAHDCNLPLAIDTSISTIYSNILYWLADPMKSLHQLGELLPSGGEFIAVFPNSDFYRNCSSYTGNDALSKLINRGRADHIMWHMDLPDFEREISRRGMFRLSHAQRYLAPLTLKMWDVGLRPLSVPLIRMANALPPAVRRDIKEEWCDTLMRFAVPLLEVELAEGRARGGYNLVVLSKR
jgi:SAM-dependent methyltransferase